MISIPQNYALGTGSLDTSRIRENTGTPPFPEGRDLQRLRVSGLESSECLTHERVLRDEDDSPSAEAGSYRERLREQRNRQRFRDLVTEWREECSLMSSTTQKAMHPAYQQIIGMGRDALRLIFEELENSPGHWFWALCAITGENPVAPEHAGNLAEMTKAWLEWGRQHDQL